MPNRRTRKPSNLEQLVKKAVLEAFEKFIQTRPIKLPKGKALDDVPAAANNKELMAKLLQQHRSDDEILEIFRERYAREGKTDEEWIEARVRIYQRLAERSKKRRPRRTHAA